MPGRVPRSVRPGQRGDHHDPLGRDSRPLNLGRLAKRDADHAIHLAQNHAIQGLVTADTETFVGPAVRDSDDRDARSSRRKQPDDVGFIAVRTQDVDLPVPETTCQLNNGPYEPRGVVLEHPCLEPMLPDPVQKRLASPALPKREKGRPIGIGQGRCQAEHLMLRAP